MRRSFWLTYSTSLVCGWDRCCCRRPLQSQLWSRWGSFLQRGFEAPYWFYWSPTQKSRCSRPDGTQPGGKSGQTCVENIVAEGQSVWETCFSAQRFIFFLNRLMNLKSLLVWLHTHWGGFYIQDLPHFLHTLVLAKLFNVKGKWLNGPTGWKKLNFSSAVTVFILSTGTDLLILGGQTGASP